MRIEEEVDVARNPQEVWDFVVDPMNDPLWCPKVKEVTPTGERRWTVLHKPVPFRPAKELRVEHLELQPPHRVVMREEDEVSVFEVEYRLDPIPGGTRFVQTSEFEWKRLPRFLHGTFNRGVRRDVRAQLRELRTALDPSG